MTLQEFAEKHCTGRQYDSCIGTPCTWSSGSGCFHPLHPKNASEGLRAAAVATGSKALLLAWARAELDKCTDSTPPDSETPF
jgi:hypothetical protein